MCSLKIVFLACYSVKYDVRLVLNASTSSIFNKFYGKLFQSLMVRIIKQVEYNTHLGVCLSSNCKWST